MDENNLSQLEPGRAALFGRTTWRRRGLTLVELTIAMAVMVMIMGTLEALGTAVQTSSEYCESRGTCSLHGRVVLEHLGRYVNAAWVTQEFPGFYVQESQVGAYAFPDTLVVWSPASTDGPREPTGMPYCDELLIICPDPAHPNRLVMIRSNLHEPFPKDKALWEAKLNELKASSGRHEDELTNLLRTAAVSAGGSAATRGVVRFDDEDFDVEAVSDGMIVLRGHWLRIELQLVSPSQAASRAVPFFGSAMVYYAGSVGASP